MQIKSPLKTTATAAKKLPYTLYSLVLAVYFFAAPFEDVLTSSTLGSLAKYLGLAAISAILVYFFYYLFHENFKGDMSFMTKDVLLILLPAALIFLSWLSYFWSIDPDATFSRNTAYTLLPLMFIAIYTVSYTRREYETIKTLAILGGIAAAVYLIITVGFSSIMSGRLMLNEDNDPNNLAALVLLPAAFAFERVFDNKEGKKRFLWLAFFAVLALTLFFTGSRGGLIAFAAFIVIYLVLSKRFQNPRTALIILFSLGLLVVLALVVLPPEMISRLFTLSSYQEVADADTQRLSIWSVVVRKILPEMPLWGLGSGCDSIALAEFFGELRGTHNTYLQMFVEYGILGLPIFIWFLIMLLRRLRFHGAAVERALLLSMMMVIFVLGAYAKKFFWNVLFICAICLKTLPEEVKQNDSK